LNLYKIKTYLKPCLFTCHEFYIVKNNLNLVIFMEKRQEGSLDAKSIAQILVLLKIVFSKTTSIAKDLVIP